jgi:transcriptional antiterminator RfaH
MKNSRRWYLIHTKPSSETLAQTNLSRQGYEVYLPMLLRSFQGSGRLLERVIALFPRYIFLRLREGDQPLAPVRSSVGVSCVVRFGSSYAVVPDQLIRDLQAHADPESGLHRMARRRCLESGAKVSITGGSFKGLEGVFEREAGADRVVVLLGLLGQDVSVRLPACSVLPSHAA